MIQLYNTLKRKKEVFYPLDEKCAKIYACGPTVYFYAHIGNLRTYIFEDILKRTILYNGYDVDHVMNITDVGHLTDDGDTGEDKMEKGAKREGKTAWEVAEKYTKAFKKDLKELNVVSPNTWIKATETIEEQISLIQKMEKEGYAYVIKDGVYFDTSKISDYGKLAELQNVDQEEGARVEPVPGKKNPKDFALWKLTPKGVKRQMEWESPWGKGFPGWHTECVVMCVKTLGIPVDIHCGGVDHIPVHHTNEMAQAQAVYNQELSRFWMHGEFMNLKEDKMSKSKGKIITVEKLKEESFSPLDYRYFCLTTHYRKKMQFSYPALRGARAGLESIKNKVREIRCETKVPANDIYRREFLECINDDLNIPKALAVTWKMLRSNLSNEEKYATILSFDRVLGLRLDKEKETIPYKIKTRVDERERLRKEGKFDEADKIRKEIEELGYHIEDTPKGINIKRI